MISEEDRRTASRRSVAAQERAARAAAMGPDDPIRKPITCTQLGGGVITCN